MSSLGSLVVSLAMDTARFSADIGKAAQQMGRLTAEAAKVGAAIGATIGAGVIAIGALVKSSVDAADKIGELAEMYGLSVEELSGLGYAAKLSATDTETLTTSLGKLAKQAAEAASGSESARAVWAAMGVSVKGSDGALKGSSALLKEVADKFAGYKDGAEKTALAQELFGKSGAAMIPMLNRGAAGLAELQAEASQLGIVLSKETAEAAGQFNDRLDQLSAAKEGLGMQIAQRLLPALNSVTTALFEGAKNSDFFGRAAEVAATGVKILVSAGAVMAGVMKTLGESLGGVAAAAVAFFSGNWAEAASIIKGATGDFAKNIRGTVSAVSTIWDEGSNKVASNASANAGKLAAPIVKAAKEAEKKKSELQKILEDIDKQLKNMQLDVDTQGASDRVKGFIELVRKGAHGDQLELYLKLAKQQDDFKASTEAANKAEKARQDILSEGNALYESTRTPAEVLAKEIDNLNYLLQQGAINWDVYARAQFAAQDRFDEATKPAEKAASDMEKFIEQARKNFQESMGDGFVQMMNGNFKSIGDGFKGMLQRMIAEALAANLTRAIFGDPKGGGINGSIFSSLLRFFGFANGGAFSGGSQITPFANGGIVSQPTLFGMRGGTGLMGEAGPEAIMPLKRGRDGKLGVAVDGDGGGVTVVNNYHVAAGVTRNELMSALQMMQAQQQGQIDTRLRRAGVA